MNIKNLTPHKIKKMLKEFVGGDEDPDKIEDQLEKITKNGKVNIVNGNFVSADGKNFGPVPTKEEEMSSPPRNIEHNFSAATDFGWGIVDYDAKAAPEMNGAPLTATIRTAQIRAKANLRDTPGYRGESIPVLMLWTASGDKGTMYVKVVPQEGGSKKEEIKKAVKGLPNCKPNFECGGIDELEIAQAHGKNSIPTISQVRTALGLGKGGFEDSVIDAIMNFQVANKLRCDGCVGKLTHPVLAKMSKNYTVAVKVPPQKYNISGFYRGLYSGAKPTELLDYIKRTSKRETFKSGGVVPRDTKAVSTKPELKTQKNENPKSEFFESAIMTAGDSLLEGSFGIGDQLQKMFPAIKFFRSGKGGMSSGQILNGGRGKPGYLNAVASVKPKILILNGGVNDILSTRKASVVTTNLEKVLKDAQSRKIKALYIPIVIPTRGTDTIYTNKKGVSSKVFIEKEEAQRRCIAANKKMQQLCETYGATYLAGVENTILNKEDKGDNLHLSAGEYRKIAQLIKQKIDPILSSIVKESLQRILLKEEYPPGQEDPIFGPIQNPKKPGQWLTKYKCSQLKSQGGFKKDFACIKFFTDSGWSPEIQDHFIQNDSMKYSEWLEDDGSKTFGMTKKQAEKQTPFKNPCYDAKKIQANGEAILVTGDIIDEDDIVPFARKEGCKNDPINYKRLGLASVYQWRKGVYAGTCGPGYAVLTGAGVMSVDHKGVHHGHLWIGVPGSFRKEDGKYPGVEAWKKWLFDNGLMQGQCIKMTGENKSIIVAAYKAWDDILKNKKYRTWFYRFNKDDTLKNAVSPAIDIANSAMFTIIGGVQATAEFAGGAVDAVMDPEWANNLGYDFMTNTEHQRMGEYTTPGWIYRETTRSGSSGRSYVTKDIYKLYDGSEATMTGNSREEREERYNNTMMLFHYGDEERYFSTIKKINDWMEKHGYFTRQNVDPSIADRLGIKTSRGSEKNYIVAFSDNLSKIKFFLGLHNEAKLGFDDINSLKTDNPSENFRKNFITRKSQNIPTYNGNVVQTGEFPTHMAETGVEYDDYEAHFHYKHHHYSKSTGAIKKDLVRPKRKIKQLWWDRNENNLVDPGELVYPVRGFDGSRFGDNPFSQGYGDGPGNENYNNEFFGIYKLIVDCLGYQPFSLINYSYNSRMKNLKKIIPFFDELIGGTDVANIVPYFLKQTHDLGFMANKSHLDLQTVDYYSNEIDNINPKFNYDSVSHRVASMKNCAVAMKKPICKQFGPWRRAEIDVDESGMVTNRPFLINPLIGTDQEDKIIGDFRVLFLDEEGSKNPWSAENIKRAYENKNKKLKDIIRELKDDEFAERVTKECCYYGNKFNPTYYNDDDSESRSLKGANDTSSGPLNSPLQATHTGGGMFKLLKTKGEKNSHSALASYVEFFAMMLPALKVHKVFSLFRAGAISKLGTGKAGLGAFVALSATEILADIGLTYLFVDDMAKLIETSAESISRNWSDQDDIKLQLLKFASEQQAARKEFLEDVIKEIDQKVSSEKYKIGSLDNFCSNHNHEMYLVNIFGDPDGDVYPTPEEQEEHKKKVKEFVDNISSSTAITKYKSKMANIAGRQIEYADFLKEEIKEMMVEIENSIKDESKKKATMKQLKMTLKSFRYSIKKHVISGASKRGSYLNTTQEDAGKKEKIAINQLIQKAKLKKASSGRNLMNQNKEDLMIDQFDPYFNRFYDIYFILLSACYYKDYEDEVKESLNLAKFEDFETKKKKKKENNNVTPEKVLGDKEEMDIKHLRRAVKKSRSKKK